MVSYFKRLKDLSSVLDSRIRASRNGTPEYNKWFESQKVLASVIKYVLDYGTSSLNNRIRAFWDNNCEYPEAMEKLGVDYECYRSSISRVSRIFYNDLGVTLLDFIDEGRFVDAHIEFMVRTKQLVMNGLIPLEVVNMLPQPDFNSVINIEECTSELKLLKQLTLVNIRNMIDGVDKSKLAHLLAIMNGESDYSSMALKKKLWGYIIGKDELKAMMNDLKVRNLIP